MIKDLNIAFPGNVRLRVTQDALDDFVLGSQCIQVSRRAHAGTRATRTTASACPTKSWPNHSPPNLSYADRTLITGVKDHTCFRITHGPAVLV